MSHLGEITYLKERLSELDNKVELLNNKIEELERRLNEKEEQVNEQLEAEKELVINSVSNPIWSNLPDWAQWIAMDSNGEWFCFEVEPTAMTRIWLCEPTKQYQSIEAPFMTNVNDWQKI